MIKNAMFFAFLTISSYASSIEEIVKHALNNNNNLRSMENSILIATQQIKIANKWKNPSLTLGANDLQSPDFLRRDLEAMQARYIGFSQVIPFGNKQELKKDLANKQKEIEELLLQDKKLELKAKIYEYSYTILILQKKYELLNKYEDNLISIKKLLNALYENTKINQNSIIQTDINLVKLKLKKHNLENRIKSLYLSLEELSYLKIESISASLKLEEKKLNKNFETHPKIVINLKKIEKTRDLRKLEEDKKIPDVKFNIAYFSRDDKYKDYVNLSFNIPLSLYGTENVKALQAKFKTKQEQEKLKALEQNFKISISILQNNINNSLARYNLLQKTIIPLKQKMQENLENYNSFDQIKPQDSIKNLNDVISYELQVLDEMNQYFSFISKAMYFTQGL